MTSREEIINSLNACMDVHRSGLWSSGCAFCSYAKRSNPKCFMDLTKDAVALLREEPEQKHGHWVVHGGRIGKNVDNRILECTVCNNYLSMSGVNGGRGNANYCPNCGAIMDEEVKQDG